MLTDIPYSELKKDNRAYDIMLLRDQYDNSFSAISEVYEISSERVYRVYCRIKIRQIRLYISHIAFVLGYESTAPILKIYQSAYDFYRDLTFAGAYLEIKFYDILLDYRKGEPGMPRVFLEKLPPFRKEITEEEVEQVVHMRETEHATFKQIAEKLHLTHAKAKRVYELFYHAKVLALVEELQSKANSEKEKTKIWEDCFRMNLSSKKRYEILCERNGSRGKTFPLGEGGPPPKAVVEEEQ